jgi:hypothetical protein
VAENLPGLQKVFDEMFYSKIASLLVRLGLGISLWPRCRAKAPCWCVSTPAGRCFRK